MAKLTFKDLATEEEICEFLGINEKALATLRNEEGLPCVMVNRNKRLYLVPSLVEWLETRTYKSDSIEKRPKSRTETETGHLKLRMQILERDNFTCQYCGRKPPDVVLHIDHVHPRSRGGKNEMSNLVTSCRECNIGKSDVLLKNLPMAVSRLS